ncbi:MAG: chorismate-binding protein [Parachlamydiaceae bacterium]
MKLNPNSWAVLTKDADHCYVGLGASTWRAKPSDLCFYLPDFFLKHPAPYLHFEQIAIVPKLKLLELLPDGEPVKHSWEENGRPAFKEAFASLNHLKKVVPYIGFHSSQPQEPFSLLKSALRYHLNHPHTTLYGFWDGKEGMIGATPEKLFIKNQEQLQSEAVAGTLPVAQKAQLLGDPKLLFEHQLVIEGIRESLKPLAQLTAGATTIKDYGPLSHLVTPLSAHLSNEYSIETLVQALHPTPALGAHPKDSGRKWLEDYAKSVPRLRYGAPCGIIDHSNAKLYVAIRNVQLYENQSTIFAGCGIVQGSDLTKELQEIQLKFKSIQAILNSP